jgi:hypothetical protein
MIFIKKTEKENLSRFFYECESILMGKVLLLYLAASNRLETADQSTTLKKALI